MKIRFITGRGGRIDQGLSAYLATLTDDYDGLAADSALLNRTIDEQVQIVRSFTETSTGGHLIVNSYGGYLLMLSLIDENVAPEKVLMISPLLGRSLFPDRMMASRPPRERLLRSALAEGRVARPSYVRLVTGEDDPICCPNLARQVSQQLHADRLDLLANEDHSLSRDVVSKVITEFLAS